MKIYVAPEITTDDGNPSVFLAGSIEMGTAHRWQDDFIKEFQNESITFFNPYRNDFDASQEQKASNPYFRQQVEWELEHLEKSNIIVLYFDPKTKSPISLLEMGLFHKKKMIVCCPQGFWRKGNVDIVCERYGIELIESLPELVKSLKNTLRTNY